MTFQTITYKGFQAQVTGHVTDGYDVGLVYLEMIGAEAEIRAIWARLVSAEMRRSGYVSTVDIGKGSGGVRMEKNTKYVTLRAALPDGQHVISLLHPRATVTEPGSVFYIVEEASHEGPPPAFFPRLVQALPVPVKEEWASWLWERGLGYGEHDYQKLIKKLSSHGHVVGYEVKGHDVCAWLKIIRDELGFEGGGDTTWSPNAEEGNGS